MSWRDTMTSALTPDRAIAIEDERHFGNGGQDYRDAAVLIAITDQAEPTVILTQRPDWLRTHAGQIAFPGGKIDPDDVDAVAAALREAEEEIALPTAAVQILGVADTYYTGSGYRISPVVGIIPPHLPLHANPQEVDDWFDVPLSYLLDPKSAIKQTALWQGHMRDFYEIIWNDRRIWGVTAGIIANLSRRYHP